MARRAVIAAALLALAVAGCGSDDGPEPDAASTSPAPGTVSESASAPTLPEPIPDVTPVVRLDERLRGQRSIDGQPDWLLAVDDLIWTKRDDGTVTAIDPDESGTVADIPTGYFTAPTCQGIAYDGQRLWTCAGPQAMVAIDPRTERAGDPVRVSRLNDQTQYPVAAGQLWVVDGSAKSLKGLSIDDGSVVTTTRLGAFCTDLARAPLDAPNLYVVCPSDGLVLQVDPAAGQVTRELQLDLPQVAALGDDLWVGFDGGLAQVSPDDLTVTAVYGIAVGLTGGIDPTDDGVWVKDASGTSISQIDPVEQRFVSTVKGAALGVGDLLVVGDTLWTTNSDKSLLFELSTS